jgi:hypothetical protein
MVDAATDRSRVRFDDHVVETEPVEHTLVRLVHHAVGLPHPLLVAIERVRVLHQELACAQEPVARTELIAVLPFHLIDVDRQVTVGGELLLDQRGHDLLLGGTEQELAPVPVLEAEHQVAVRVPTAREPPGLDGKDDRHPELLGAGRVHLLANDPLDLLHRAEPQGHRGVDPRRDLPDEGRPQQQPMGRDLGLRRILPERSREQLRYPHGTDKDTGEVVPVGLMRP